MDLVPLPHAVLVDVVRQQEKLGWPDMVPAFAELPNGHFTDHASLTVADCEQIVEWRTRRARKALERLERSPTSRVYLRRAARHILYARLYRCQYLTLIGKTDSTEADMPFPLLPE